MTKSHEIQALRKLAADLGPASYCGPWLASVADEVEQQVRSDFFPTPSIASTQAKCTAMLVEAAETAAQVEVDARTKADKMIRATEDRISSIKDRAAIELRSALQKLEGWL